MGQEEVEAPLAVQHEEAVCAVEDGDFGDVESSGGRLGYEFGERVDDVSQEVDNLERQSQMRTAWE